MVRTTAPALTRRPSAVTTPVTAPLLDGQVLDGGLDDLKPRRGADRRLHGLAIELAVGLGAGPLHRRALAAVEHAELDAGRVGDPAHQAVQRVDLAHQMALAEAADGRIAGHLADGLEVWVSSAVRAPMRAAAAAASQPAWPPPMTMTSN